LKHLSVAAASVQVLAAAGVRVAFTVPGESFLDLLDEIGQSTAIRLISARHEGGASFMAEAYGKATGQPAVALASRGPGGGNLAIGIHTAMQDQTPMLAIVGQVESDLLGKEAFQEVDLEAFFGPICKLAVEPRAPGDVPLALAEGLHLAMSGRPGPVVVAVPPDFWSAEFSAAVPGVGLDPPQLPTPDDVARLDALLRRAARPVAIVGPVTMVDRPAMERLAEQYDLGVFSAFRRQDTFSEEHTHYLGHLRSNVDHRVRQALTEADLVVVLGTRLDGPTSQNFTVPGDHQDVAMVGLGLGESGGKSVERFECLPTAMITALAATPPKSGDGPWLADRHRAFVDFSSIDTTSLGVARGVHPTRAIAALRSLADSDAYVTSDAGNFAGFLNRYWIFSAQHRFLGPCSGAMGYGVPAAVAARIADPGRQAIAVVGDGGFLMTGTEVETAVRNELDIKVVVLQNGLYGTIAMHQARVHGRLHGTEIGAVDITAIARGLGASAHTVSLDDELVPCLTAALNEPGTSVVTILTDPDVIAPERSLARMLVPAPD
jgi:acetolactate synthase-1/2/3 large subunit